MYTTLPRVLLFLFDMLSHGKIIYNIINSLELSILNTGDAATQKYKPNCLNTAMYIS